MAAEDTSAATDPASVEHRIAAGHFYRLWAAGDYAQAFRWYSVCALLASPVIIMQRCTAAEVERLVAADWTWFASVYFGELTTRAARALQAHMRAHDGLIVNLN